MQSPKTVEEHAVKVWVYVDASKEADDPKHLKIFANIEAAAQWLEHHDPEGAAFECEVLK